MNYCHAGHKKHDRKTVKSLVGDMLVYDYDQYMGFAGYCTGQDGVSETIEKTGSWDIDVHHRIELILDRVNEGSLFIDVGSHIGYFSKLARNLGCNVFSFDGDRENLELLKINVPEADYKLIWFDKEMTGGVFTTNMDIILMKIDIEGLEEYAIEYFEPFFEKEKVKNVIMEVSPCFNDSYPDLINRMVDYGFEVFELDGTKFDFDYNFHQKDLWLKLASNI